MFYHSAPYQLVNYTGIYTIILLRLKNRQELQEEQDEMEKKYEEILTETDVAQLSRAQRRARARHIMKQQRRVAPLPQQQQQVAGDGALAVVADQPAPLQAAAADHDNGPVLSRKERQRLAKAAEREERKLLENERKQQQAVALKEAQQRKMERLQVQARQQEQARVRQEEEKVAADRAQKEAWETFLCNHETGTKLLVSDWLAQCQQNRIVALDALAEEFGVALENVAQRIKQLVSQQRVAGVFTKNGNTFVVFGELELQSLADLVRTRGCMDANQVADWMNQQVTQHVAPLH